jgi:hypothetical protein
MVKDLVVCNVVAVLALPDRLPLNDAVTVPGKEVLPEPSRSVAVLVSVENTPVY